jgi:hypothetical protein
MEQAALPTGRTPLADQSQAIRHTRDATAPPVAQSKAQPRPRVLLSHDPSEMNAVTISFVRIEQSPSRAVYRRRETASQSALVCATAIFASCLVASLIGAVIVRVDA